MKKRIVKVSMITAACFIIAYIAVSLWASFSILNLMKNAEEQQAYSEDFKGIISNKQINIKVSEEKINSDFTIVISI